MDALCPLSDSACSAPTLIINELQMWHDFRQQKNNRRKIMEYEKNGLPFPFSFVIETGEYVLFPRVKIFATIKTI